MMVLDIFTAMLLHGNCFHDSRALPQGDSHQLSRSDCLAVVVGVCARKVVTVPFGTAAWPDNVLKHALRLLAALTLAAQLSPAQAPQSTAESAGKEQATPSRGVHATRDIEKAPGGSSQAVASIEQKIEQIAASGRIQQMGESSSTRLNPALALAPGAPPILAFRYLDGQARHRFGDLDLVMDDAGH